MNLLKELKKTSQQNAQQIIKEQDELLVMVQENLRMEEHEDLKMLSHFGTGEIMKKAVITKKSAVEKGEYLTEADVADVCTRYALKCLSTSFYKNEVPIAALNDMRNFEKDNGLSLNKFNLRIIAPKSHFKLTSRPKQDPILLYKNENDNYRIISVWGNDFTSMQRVKGLMSANNISTFFIISVFITGQVLAFINLTVHGVEKALLMVLIGFLSLIIGGMIGIPISGMGTAYNDEHEA